MRGASPLPTFAQHGHLRLAANDRRARDLPPRPHVPRGDRLPRGDGQRLSLDLLRIELLVVGRVRGRAERGLAHDDAIGRRGGLQTRRGVDDVARGHGLAFARLRAEHDEGLTGVDADANTQAELRVRGVHGGDGMLDRERRSDRALGVILVRHRCTEDRHDGIPDELLDGATVAFEHCPQLYVVRIEHAAHGFGIELFSLGGETDEIGKQDRDDLALFEARSRGSE